MNKIYIEHIIIKEEGQDTHLQRVEDENGIWESQENRIKIRLDHFMGPDIALKVAEHIPIPSKTLERSLECTKSDLGYTYELVDKQEDGEYRLKAEDLMELGSYLEERQPIWLKVD